MYLRADVLNRVRPLTLALVATSLAATACTDASPLETEGSTAPLTLTRTCPGGCSDLYIVAHEDDDLLFMNPDIHNSIRAGNKVRVVYVTAGDASGVIVNESYWRGREDGSRAAYAAMAARPVSDWVMGTPMIGGRHLQVNTLNGTNVSLVFLRLPDSVSPTFFPICGPKEDGTFTLTSFVDVNEVANTYTKSQLITILPT